MINTIKSGIYRIVVKRNSKQDKYYIGQSINMFKRWASHLRELRLGQHKNQLLQKAFLRYGEEAFSFEVVVTCEPQKGILSANEQAILDGYDRSSVYNMKLECVDSSLGIVASPERRAKISSALTGIIRSEETRAKVGAAQAWKRTPEGKLKMSASLSGIYPSEKTRAKMSASHMGKSPSEETIAKRNATREAKKKEKGTVYSDEGLASIRKASHRRRGQSLSEEHRKNIGESLKGRSCSEKTRVALIERNRRRGLDRAVLLHGSEWMMY